jgi:hypothetical protein
MELMDGDKRFDKLLAEFLDQEFAKSWEVEDGIQE